MINLDILYLNLFRKQRFYNTEKKGELQDGI